MTKLFSSTMVKAVFLIMSFLTHGGKAVDCETETEVVSITGLDSPPDTIGLDGNYKVLPEVPGGIEVCEEERSQPVYKLEGGDIYFYYCCSNYWCLGDDLSWPEPDNRDFDCAIEMDGYYANGPTLSVKPVTVGSNGDPHLHLAHGGSADFRGSNNTYYNLLSAPGINFAALTMDSDFLLPTPQLVHGSFFTKVAWVVRGRSERSYAIVSDANKVAFDVLEAQAPQKVVAQRSGAWQFWEEDGVLVFYKHQTVFVRANGWEVNATRKPIYNPVRGPSTWRFDIAMRTLDGTIFTKEFGASSASCFPHGIIGQSWDGDNIAVSGKVDDYKDRVEVTTTAMAEGAIEGSANDYALSNAFDVDFKYSRFAKVSGDVCAPRDVSKLSGFKGLAKGNTEAVSTSEVEDDIKAADTAKQE